MTIEEKIDKIYDTVIEHKHSQVQHRKELDEHAKALAELEAIKNKTLGIVGILGIAMGALATWILKHFN